MVNHQVSPWQARTPKNAIIAVIIIIIGAIGISRLMGNIEGTTPKFPTIADADDTPVGATILVKGENYGDLSETDTVDYWEITVGTFDLIKVIDTAGFGWNLSVLDEDLSEMKQESTPQGFIYSPLELPWKTQQTLYVRVVNTTAAGGNYLINLDLFIKTPSIETFVLQFAIIAVCCASLIIVNQITYRNTRNPLDLQKKRRPLLFAAFCIPSVVTTWQYWLIANVYAQLNLFYSDANIMEAWVFRLTVPCIIFESILAIINLAFKKRIFYNLARGGMYGELVFVFIDIMVISSGYISSGFITHAREALLVFSILCINFFLRKVILASYGKSFGVFSFKKDKKIRKIFGDLYAREEIVPISKLMTDFCFEQKRVRKAQIQLMKLLHEKVIPGEFDEKSKFYFPKERSAAQKALQKMAIDQKKRLFGILKTMGWINFREDQRYLGLTRDDIVGMVKELQEKGFIEGIFEGDAFVLKSDVNNFIASLETSFAEWTGKVESGQGKKI